MRFAVIGVGTIGLTNVRALCAFPQVRIVAVANRTREKAEALCKAAGLSCPVYTDWKKMLAEEKPEAVLIQLYNDMHYECFMTCAHMGIHILVEKPLANRYEQCLEMIEVARENGIKASVLQTQRYGSVLQTAKDYLQKHRRELGELICISDQENCDYFHKERPAWHLDPQRSGGGIVLNYGVHQLDRVHWLMDQKTETFHARYFTKKPGINTVSSYAIMGTGEKGTVYMLTCNGYSGPWINEILLTFTGGVVRCRVMDNPPMEKGVYVGNPQSGRMEKIPAICEDGDGNHEMYCREMAAALDYFAGVTEKPPVSLEWAAEMVRLCCLGFTQT